MLARQPKLVATQPLLVVQPQANDSRTSLPVFALTWSIVVLVAVAAVIALDPPRPQPASSPATDFSAERAMFHVREIARAPHPLGSRENAAVRSYLLAQLAQLGVQANEFSGVGINSTRSLVTVGQTDDIVGLLAGYHGGPAMMLTAHYDSVRNAPGAADDSAGVATILEIVRALRAGPALQHDLVVLFTDGEEPGLLGADAFAHSHPWAQNLGLILNFEARGSRGPSLLFETSANNGSLIGGVARAAPHPIGSSLFYELYKLLPNDTDFTVFKSSQTPGLNFAFGEGLEDYHSPLDTPEHLSPASVQHQGSNGLALVRYFGQNDLTGLRNKHGDDVFFDWYGDRLVTYNQRWVIPGQLLMTGLFALLFVRIVRRSEVSVRRFLLGLALCLALIVAVSFAAAVEAWLLSMALAGRRVLDDSAATLFVLCGLLFLSAWLSTLLLKWFGKAIGILGLSLAGLSWVFVLSWLAASFFPSGSYLIFWPLMLAIAGHLLCGVSRKDGLRSSIFNLPAAVVTTLLFAPLIYLLYVFLTLQMVLIVASAVLVSLLFLISIPLLKPCLAAPMWWSTLTVGAAGLVCVGCGIFLSGYTSDHPRPDSIIYSLNADENRAVWMSYDDEVDDWTRRYLTDHPGQATPMPDYLAGLTRTVLSASAPAISLPAPVVEDLQQSREGDIHRIKLRIRSERNADVLYLRFADGVVPVSLKLAGREVPVHKGGHFGVTVYGMGNTGVELELVVAGSHVSFWLMDRSEGLPKDVAARPANLVATAGSDVTFVCRKYTL